MQKDLWLNGEDLEPWQIAAIAEGKIRAIRIDPAALRRVREANSAFLKQASQKKVYGTHTGLGSRAKQGLSDDADRNLTITAASTHSGVFDYMDGPTSQAMLAVKINSFLTGGHGAVTPELVSKLADVFNYNDFHSMPKIPALGTGEADLNSSAMLAKWWLFEIGYNDWNRTLADGDRDSMYNEMKFGKSRSTRKRKPAPSLAATPSPATRSSLATRFGRALKIVKNPHKEKSPPEESPVERSPLEIKYRKALGLDDFVTPVEYSRLEKEYRKKEYSRLIAWLLNPEDVTSPYAEMGYNEGISRAAKEAAEVDESGEFRLSPGEDLALIAGNDYCNALLAINIAKIERLMDIAYAAFGVSNEAFRAQPEAYAPEVAEACPNNSLKLAINCINRIMEGSKLLDGGNRNLQDPNSFRTFPQVAAAAETYLKELTKYLGLEMNSATQNPYFSASSEQIVHNGNFDTTYASVTLSALQLALAKLADISFKRLSKVCDPHYNGLAANEHTTGIQASNITNIGGQALGKVISHARQNITDMFSVNFQNGIEDSVSGVFQQLLETDKMVTYLKVVLACELAVGIESIRERTLTDGDIEKESLSPTVAKIYDYLLGIINRAFEPGKASDALPSVGFYIGDRYYSPGEAFDIEGLSEEQRDLANYSHGGSLNVDSITAAFEYIKIFPRLHKNSRSPAPSEPEQGLSDSFDRSAGKNSPETASIPGSDHLLRMVTRRTYDEKVKESQDDFVRKLVAGVMECCNDFHDIEVYLGRLTGSLMESADRNFCDRALLGRLCEDIIDKFIQSAEIQKKIGGPAQKQAIKNMYRTAPEW